MISWSCLISFLLIKSVQSDIFADSFAHNLYSLFTFCEYTLWIVFFLANIERRAIRLSVLILSIGVIGFLIWYPLSASIERVDSIPIGVETISILLVSFYFLYELMNQPKMNYIYNDYRFWIVTGMCLYLAGSFFYYILAQQLDRKTLESFRFISYLFYIIKNVFFAISILIFAKNTKSNSFYSKPIPNLDFY